MIQIAIKAGQILHVANKFLVDRLQTAGASSLNIPTEKIYELGNYQSVAVVRDVPDLTFTLDCLDVSTEVEAILCGGNPGGPLPNSAGQGGDPDGTKYSLGVAQPIDIISPMKSKQGAFNIVRGVAVPHLTLESASYRYGLRDNAGENFSLRGDAIFYIPGRPVIQEETGDGVATTWTFNDAEHTAPGVRTALLYEEGGESFYALSVTVGGRRLVHGSDYTDTANGITLTAQYLEEHSAPGVGEIVRIVFGTRDPNTTDEDQYGQSVHEGVTVKPAAIRGKNIQVYVGGLPDGNNRGTYADNTAYAIGDTVYYNGVWYTAAAAVAGTNTTPPADDATWDLATSTPFRWSEVQSTTVDWRVTLEDDYEFGNARAVSREPTDAPEVTGSIELKPMTAETLFRKLNQITGVDADNVVGPQSSVVLPIEIVLHNPDSGGATGVAPGAPLKTLYVPDALFTIPGYEGRVQQKLVTTMNFESDTGVLEVFKGARV